MLRAWKTLTSVDHNGGLIIAVGDVVEDVVGCKVDSLPAVVDYAVKLAAEHCSWDKDVDYIEKEEEVMCRS